MSPLHKQNDEIPKPGDVTYFAKSDYRNRGEKFGIKREDRTRHTYVIGKTGMGKTTLLENMAVQDIRNGNGLTFIDPHGEVADNLLDYVPEDRIDDVMYFAPFDLDHPISFNVMEDVGHDKRHLVADGLLSAFKKIWVDMWSGRMEYLLNNALLALLEYPDATILGVNRMFADEAYRKRVVANVSDVSVKSFWVDEYANYDENFARQAASAIQNKVGQFVSNPQVRNIVGQVNSSFDTREMMDENKIMLINLSKGQVGEDNARLIGSMLITKMYLAAMSRADTGGNGKGMADLPQHYFYVDEFQSFANESFAGILSEARKYKLNLTMAHQYIEQMTEDVRNAVFGNVGTMITFRVGAFDAEVLEKEFAPEFEAEDLVNLGFAQIYLKLMINGVSSKPFSARTLPPIEPREDTHREEIIAYSREEYGRPRETVKEEIDKWHESTFGIIDDELAMEMAEKQQKQREESGEKADVDLSPEEKRMLVDRYEVGDVVDGPVVGIADFGIFVEVDPGLAGLVHISELADEQVDDPADLYEEGERVRTKVIGKDDDKISLSISQLTEEEKAAAEEADGKGSGEGEKADVPSAPAAPQEDTSADKEKTEEEKVRPKKEPEKAAAEDTESSKKADAESETESGEAGTNKQAAATDSKDFFAEDEGGDVGEQSVEKEAADEDGKDSDPTPEDDTRDTDDGDTQTASLKEAAADDADGKDKGPSTANKSKLQAALANVKKPEKERSDANEDQAKGRADDKQESPTAEREPQDSARDESGEEIPEDELREMLAVDEADE